jgi:hypothetical protein
MKYVRSLKFTEDPDYDRFIDTFVSSVDPNGVSLFDWEVLQGESRQNRILAHFMATHVRRFSDIEDGGEEEASPKKKMELTRKKSLIDMKRKAIRQDPLLNLIKSFFYLTKTLFKFAAAHIIYFLCVYNYSIHFRGEDNEQRQPKLVKV